MDKEIKIAEGFSEFNYSEDAQMALNSALYANEFDWDGVKEKAVDGTIKIIFMPMMLAGYPASMSFAEINIPRTEQRAFYHAVEQDEVMPEQTIQTDEVIEETSPYTLTKAFVKNLATLPKDLPGADFEVPSRQISDNAIKFLDAMEVAGLNCPEEGNVMPSVFGTIVIDVITERGLVSMEIGRTKVGFFTDFEDGINEESDGLLTDFNTIPSPLLKHLKT